MKWTIGILVILGLLAALSVMILIGALRKDDDMRNAKGDADVVVIKRALPAMSAVNLRFLETKKLPRKTLPVGYLTDPIQAIGKVLNKNVVEGEVLTRDCFLSEGTGSQLAASIPHGMRAISVPISSRTAESNLLYPGCVVDVVVSFKLRGKEAKGQALSTTLLHGIQVLAVRDETIVSKHSETEKKVAKKTSSRRLTVTLLVDTRQAEAMQLAMENGVVSLAMRNPLDKRPVDIDATVLSQGRLAKLGSLLSSSVATSQVDSDWLEAIDANDPNALVSSIVAEKRNERRLQEIFSSGFGERSGSGQWEVTVIRGSDVTDEVLEAASGEEE